MIELTERLVRAQAVADSIGDERERSHVEAMIRTWRNGGEWPSWSSMTPPMAVVANILRGVTA